MASDSCGYAPGQQPDGRYTKFFRLGARDVDPDNRLRLGAVMNMFQETAGDQCELFGSGWNELAEKHGLCYVVVRMRVEFYAFPGNAAIIRTDTWPDPQLRTIFSRYAELFARDGDAQAGSAADSVPGSAGGWNKIASVSSQWALLDMRTRHFVRPDPSVIVMPDTSDAGPAVPLPSEQKITPALLEQRAREGAEEFAFSRYTVYSDFDYNRHMNNARYGEWIQDCFRKALGNAQRGGKAPYLRSVDIKFREEIPADIDREIKLRGIIDGEKGEFLLTGSEAAGEAEGARAPVHFECKGEIAYEDQIPRDCRG